MTKTLESITRELEGQGLTSSEEIEKRIHAASMLAFVSAAKGVVSDHTFPTPLYRLDYDKQTQTVQFEELKGRARVPKPNSLDMNMLDVVIASLLRRKMPILLEGITGVGKTYTVEQFFKTILPKEHYAALRLNKEMSNVLQPYVESKIEGGSVVRTLKTERLRDIFAIFIDEKNRGDTNKVLQIQDGEITLDTGERGQLGVPIPKLVNGSWVEEEGNVRPVFVVGAQNPPATKDAKYTATKRTDAAMNNRDLQLDVPNSAANIGSSILMTNEGNGQHRSFQSLYRQRLAEGLGVDASILETLDEDYISVLAFTTDPSKTDAPVIQSAVEFMDAMLVMTSTRIEEDYESNKKDIEEWNDVLRKYGTDFRYESTCDMKSTPMEKLDKIVKSFEEEIVTRDNTKIKKLADAVSLTRRINESLRADDPVSDFENTLNFISIQDMACGFAIMLHDKQDRENPESAGLIDQVLKEYIGIAENFANRLGYTNPFSSNDPNMSVYTLALMYAITESQSQADIVNAFVKTIGASVAELKRLENGSEYRKPIIARMIGDLTTLAGFVDQYETQASAILSGEGTANTKRQKIVELFREKRMNVNTPDIYIQRLPRVLRA